jgi:hypothetical protein
MVAVFCIPDVLEKVYVYTGESGNIYSFLNEKTRHISLTVG